MFAIIPTLEIYFKVLLMTVACCGLFILCWTPHHTYQLLLVIYDDLTLSESGEFIFMLLGRFLCQGLKFLRKIVIRTFKKLFCAEII